MMKKDFADRSIKLAVLSCFAVFLLVACASNGGTIVSGAGKTDQLTGKKGGDAGGHLPVSALADSFDRKFNELSQDAGIISAIANNKGYELKKKKHRILMREIDRELISIIKELDKSRESMSDARKAEGSGKLSRKKGKKLSKKLDKQNRIITKKRSGLVKKAGKLKKIVNKLKKGSHSDAGPMSLGLKMLKKTNNMIAGMSKDANESSMAIIRNIR